MIQKRKNRLLALGAMVLSLAMSWSMMAGCSADKEEGNLYVVKQKSYYNADGVCYKQENYSYDSNAQLLENQIHTTDAEDQLKLYGTETYTYDENGNFLTVCDVYGQATWLDSQFAWTYENGQMTGCQMIDRTGKKTNPLFTYTDGNITSEYWETFGKSEESAIFEYDQQGRLTREFSYVLQNNHRFYCESRFTYEGDHLVGVVYRTAMEGPGDLRSAAWEKCLEVSTSWELKYSGDQLIELIGSDRYGRVFMRREYAYDDKGYPAEMKTTFTNEDGTENASTERYTCDEHGNILQVLHDDGSREEYTYQAMNVTPQQIVNYHRRASFVKQRNRDGLIILKDTEDIWYYHLIPNPLHDMPYAELLD